MSVVVGWARRYLAACLIALLFATALFSGVWRELSLHDLEVHHAALKAHATAHVAMSLAIYAGVFALLVIACLPGTSILLLAGGYLFGTLLGGGVGLAAATLGSAVLFFAGRTAAGDWLSHRGGPAVRNLQQALSENGFTWLLACASFRPRLISSYPWPPRWGRRDCAIWCWPPSWAARRSVS